MGITVKISGLNQITANIERIAKKEVAKATSKAVNTVAKKAMKGAVRQVSKETKAPAKLIRKRTRLIKKAKLQNPTAMIRVNRSNLPLIRLLEDPRKKVRFSQGVLKLGQYRIARGFVQTLKNGRVHIMQRQGKERYPIDVVKIPLAIPLTEAFRRELHDYPEQIRQILSKQLTAVFHR